MRKHLQVFLFAILVVIGCQRVAGPAGPAGPQGPQGEPGVNGTSCTVSLGTGGSLISCSDGTSTFISNGAVGPVGAQGAAGANGKSVVFQTAAIAAGSTCANGGQLILLAQDDAGTGVWTSSDSHQQSVTLCNGNNAQQPLFTPAIAITPCGPHSSTYKEALLGLTGGGVYAEIITQSGNPNTIRNTLLPDQSYYDTDDSECNFSIYTDNSGNRSVSWNGSTANGSGPFSPGSASYSAATWTWTATYGPVGQ